MKLSTKLNLLSYSIGIVFILFGVLKFFPHLSPAEEIGSLTVESLSLGILSKEIALITLAILELTIGIGLLVPKFRKITIIIAIAHLVCTFSPFFIFPSEALSLNSFTPSLLGQYIIKNIVLIAALLTIYPSKEEEPVKQAKQYYQIQNLWSETMENQQTIVAIK